jgi:hypothetical protein
MATRTERPASLLDNILFAAALLSPLWAPLSVLALLGDADAPVRNALALAAALTGVWLCQRAVLRRHPPRYERDTTVANRNDLPK